MDKSENTLKNYESTINRLKKMLGGKVPENLKNSKKVIQKINEEYDNVNTKRAYYSRIIKLIKENPDWNIPKRAFDQYKKAFEDLTQQMEDIVDSNKLTDTQKNKWLQWSDILKLQKKLGTKAKDFRSFEDYLIMSLYTLNPPIRLDYTPMKVCKRCGDKMNHNINYLVWNNKPKFILNNYKTAKFHGPKEIPIGPDLKEIINEWLTLYNPEPKNKANWWFLLNDNEKGVMTQNGLSQRLISIFKKYTNKKAGLNIIRHSFINYITSGMINLKTRKKIAQAMGHTVETQLAYQKIF